MNNSTTRFSDRVEDYIKYRPSYPMGVLETLRNDCGLTSEMLVADIGSGTGILTRLLLENGNRVFGVEPNDAMREAAEKLLLGYPRFVSIAGTAEESGLPENSVDLVVAGQAFHWFDPERSKSEFRRILRQGGWVALIWNEREVEATPFLREYEDLLKRRATDYATVDHRNVGSEAMAAFFSPCSVRSKSFSNQQQFDYEALKGRCLSSSYAPNAGSPGHDDLISELHEAFEKHQENGVVTFDYQTNLYYGYFEN